MGPKQRMMEIRMHIHKYRRMNIGRKQDYWTMQCALPKCNHYVPMQSKLSAPNLIGKLSLCNRCGDTFQLNRRSLRFARPICDSCVGHKNNKLSEAAKFFKILEKEIQNDDTGTTED